MNNLKIQQNISLASMTTFKIGGPAKFFVEITSKEDLIEVIEWAREKQERFYILAGGSNVLISDDGIDGLVIKINNKDLLVEGETIRCGAGVELSAVVRKSLGNNLTGLEWAIGIPGTVGGAVRGNAGAFGLSISNSVEEAEIYDIEKNSFSVIDNKSCKFGYRHSIFKENEVNKKIIWSIVLSLSSADKKNIDELVEKYLKYRSSTQPKMPSAGSIFKNIPIEELRSFNNLLAEKAEEDGVVKSGMVAAGWLIDLLGMKGKTIGGAKISLEHANFIVNTGGATASEVVMLISYIKQQVRDRFKVQLQEEVEYLGF